MFISDRAIEHMEKTAQSVGFGPRNDYPFRGHAAVSSGDWKGSSSAVCVFSSEWQAQEYLDKVLPGLDALGSEVYGRLEQLRHDDIGDIGCIAIIVAVDLVHVDEIDQDGIYESA
ncbi:MAG: hypothetical protein OXK82_12885 [Deltaproteobacteria bacterium]|nr:hypothetical protein [Deltaproteobacteria bacterium]